MGVVLPSFAVFLAQAKPGKTKQSTRKQIPRCFSLLSLFFSKFPRCCAGCLLFFAVVLALFLCPAVYKSAWPSALLEVGAFVP